MSTNFGQVIPVVGTNFGFLGEPSRTGGGDPFIISRQLAPKAVANINFGDAVLILPDGVGGTCQQFADWIANGNPLGSGLALSCTTASSVTVTPAATTMDGIAKGMLVRGSGIPVGTYIVSVNPIAGTFTMSQAATSGITTSLQFAKFAGVAVREVKTQLGYPYTPPGSVEIGYYSPGQYVGIMVRGGITVGVPVGTPLTEGPVYLRTILNGSIPAGLVGSFEANADGVNSILLENLPSVSQVAFKNGAKDANNVCEITLTNRVAA